MLPVKYHAFKSQVPEYSTPEAPLNATIQKFVHIDSKNVVYGNNTMYKIHLKTPMENITRVDLVNLDVPMVTPNVTASKSTMRFEENGEMISFQVPIGHYGEEELCDEVQRLMNLKSRLGGGYVISFLRTRGKVHITVINNNITALKLVDSPIAHMLGFTRDQDLDSPKLGVDPSDDFYDKCVVSDSYMSVSTSAYIYLSIEELDDSYTDVSYDRENVEGVSTFGKIYTPVPLGTFLTFQSDYPIFREFSQPLRRLDTLTIHWMDSSFQDLEFFNVTHNFTLMFTTLDANLNKN